MSEMNNEFEQLLEETSLVTIHNGEVVEGTVISVKEDEIILNIGYKADGERCCERRRQNERQGTQGE